MRLGLLQPLLRLLFSDKSRIVLFIMLLLSTCSASRLQEAEGEFDTSLPRGFNHGALLIPAAEKRIRGAEDAYITTDNLIVVADGVGAWIEQGVDSGLFSRELCSHIQKLHEDSSVKNINYEPKQLMIDALAQTEAIGSSTCCIATLDPDNNIMHAANLGDSGYMLFRKEHDGFKVLFRSEDQQHAFNFPFQIGTNGNDPELSEIKSFEVQHGDILLMASDGLWDNMYEDEIARILEQSLDSNGFVEDPESVASYIATQAEELSLDTKYFSPFTQRSVESDLYVIGGKEDDIAVVVAQIFLPDYDPKPSSFLSYDHTRELCNIERVNSFFV